MPEKTVKVETLTLESSGLKVTQDAETEQAMREFHANQVATFFARVIKANETAKDGGTDHHALNEIAVVALTIGAMFLAGLPMEKKLQLIEVTKQTEKDARAILLTEEASKKSA